MRSGPSRLLMLASLASAACRGRDPSALDCLKVLEGGFRPIAAVPGQRFLGKVDEARASCRGGERALEERATPWVDWPNYWAAGDKSSKGRPGSAEDSRGLEGALLDLEYQRLELIAFNLYDNSGTYEAYVKGDGRLPGSSLKVWPQMRLSPEHSRYRDVGGGGEQLCRGELVRHRTLEGICNDLRNPAMGAAGQPFARVVPFGSAYGRRLGLMEPDPQWISRKLLTRRQAHPELCRDGLGLGSDSKDSRCDYRKADTLNSLGAFWIQFMTHDWFSHLEEGKNGAERMPTGCRTEAARALGCRPEDVIDKALVAEKRPTGRFEHGGRSYTKRARETTRNTVTAWWDASQIYGWDETSRRRVKRDPGDPAKLLLRPAVAGDPAGYLPVLSEGDPMNPAWSGQEAVAFPDNWNIGLSFFHNVFAREHDAFVDEFRKRGKAAPDADTGLRNPDRPEQPIRYRDVTPDELFEVTRLVIAAEIAKVHTLEWTTQLLYDEPMYLALNANWNGLFAQNPTVARVLGGIVGRLGDNARAGSSPWYSVFATGPGIVGQGSHLDRWDLTNPDHVNGGTHHFGSPFNFPEEFVTVYRLHPLMPDLIEYRDPGNPDAIGKRVPVVDTFRAKATPRMRSGGLAAWATSLGRQRAGALTLENHPVFLQDLPMPKERTGTGRLDVVALDLLRDRERGVPGFNELRRQLGLTPVSSFGDFVDHRLPAESPERKRQAELAARLQEVYGTVEDLDAVVGWLAETTRPHGFAISETQLQVFILEASRRLFSDRFFTSSLRPEFYSTLGISWLQDNGPDGKHWEPTPSNGHRQEVSPLKRVLLRTIPELSGELLPVVNVFDPWTRDRGEYYSLAWRPRPGAEHDESFATQDR